MLVVVTVVGLSIAGFVPAIVGLSSPASATDSTETTVQPNFSVEITTTNSPVQENETLDVFATVENAGNEAGEQTVTLSIDGEQRDSRNVKLQPGESTTVKLSWETTEGDAGLYVASVESDDGADSTEVNVRPSGGVRIDSCTIIDDPGLYLLNETINSSTIDSCIRITASDVLLRGQGFTVNGVDRDRNSVGIEVETDEARRNVTVKNLTVTRWDTGIQFGTNDSNRIRKGTIRNVTASRNRGPGIAVSGGTNNQFRNNTLENNTDALVLDGSSDNRFRTTRFRNNSRWAVSAVPSDAAGSSSNNTFASPDLGFANASLTFALRDARVTAVEAAKAPSPPSGKTDVGVYLNATDTSVTGTLDLTVNYRDRAVSGIDESTLALWRHAGNWTAVGGTLDASANTLRTEITEFSVFAPLADAPSPNFDVSIDGTNSPVTEGELLEVAATVRNTGERTGTQTVRLQTDGTSRDNATVELDPGESRTLTLVWPTADGDAGSYAATVASANDSVSTNVTVEAPNEPPEAAINYSPRSPTVGETVLVAATGSSDPDGRIESYEWQIDGEVVSTAESFEHTFESGGTHEVVLRVTDDDGATATTRVSVTVSEPTPTPTPTAAVTPTQPPEQTVPGFGVPVALLALLAVGLLAARRRA